MKPLSFENTEIAFRSKTRKELNKSYWIFKLISNNTLVKISTTLVNSATASFSAVTASAPSGLAETTEHDYLFFINGQYMEHDALEIKQNGSSFYLQVDTDGIGYELESDDEILAWGKFNS